MRGDLQLGVARSSEDAVQEPALRPGQRILPIAGAEDPEAFPSVVLDPEVIPHRFQLGIAFPPFAKNALGAVRALHAPAHATPSEGYGWMVRKKRDRINGLRTGEQARGPRPVARPFRASLGRQRWDVTHRTLRHVARNRRDAIEILFADAVG